MSADVLDDETPKLLKDIVADKVVDTARRESVATIAGAPVQNGLGKTFKLL